MGLRVTLIQGGGIGFDQVAAVKRVLDAAGAVIDWDEHLAGLASIEEGGKALPDDLVSSVRTSGLALKTKLVGPPGMPLARNLNVQFRRELGLFATVRPLKNVVGLPARFQGVDILVIRELTEDLYTAVEHQIVPGVVQSLKIVTEAASRRFFRFACEYATANGRKTIHCVHKANILKLGDGLFLEAFRDTVKEYPNLTPKEIIVDNCCMQMVSKPQQFDVMVAGNLFGDLLSDLGAGIVGGISATAGINIGDGVKVYETFHGGSRDTIGANKANPLPFLLPAIDLLEGAGQTALARRLLTAMERVLGSGKLKTVDLGGTATTTEVTEALIAALP